MNGYRDGPLSPAGWGVADEPDQVLRLHEFRMAHPDVIVGPDEFRNWQARIPEPNGETIITRYRLRELLAKLAELTSERPAEPDGNPSSNTVTAVRSTPAGAQSPQVKGIHERLGRGMREDREPSVRRGEQMQDVKTVDAGVLAISFLEDGPPDGWPVILSHGFPFDVHAYDEVVPLLASQGARVIRPWLRGFGSTRFLSAGTQRSGQQAALGSDLVALLDALELETAILAGYDWGGLASCVASVLWPGRVAGLVTLASYDILDVSGQLHAYGPALEYAVWYQHLFQTERGRECLAGNRRELCRMLWQQWSPHWRFDEATFDQTAASFDNPDFVDVVIHAYRHGFGLAAGDPAYEELEERLACRPKITVPAVTLDGVSDTLKPGGTADQAGMFTAWHEHRVIDAGHNLPQEAPAAFADAVLTMRQWLQAGELS